MDGLLQMGLASGVLNALATTLIMIGIGFLGAKGGLFTTKTSQELSKVLLNLAVPALAFTAFMTDINREWIQHSFSVLVLGFLVFPLLLVVMPLLYRHETEDTKVMFSQLTAFGSMTLFGLPIVRSLFGTEAVIIVNLYNIAFRVLLYSYSYVKMSGLAISSDNVRKIFGNLTTILTIVGVILWVAQGAMPQTIVDGASVSIFRIDQMLPWLYHPLELLAGLSSPLAWLMIGIQIATSTQSKTTSNREIYYFTFMKLVSAPLITLLVMMALQQTGVLAFNRVAAQTVTLLMATPPGNVPIVYAMSYNRSAELASKAAIVTTPLTVLAMPLWLLIVGGVWGLIA